MLWTNDDLEIAVRIDRVDKDDEYALILAFARPTWASE